MLLCIGSPRPGIEAGCADYLARNGRAMTPGYHSYMKAKRAFGDQLRGWRQRRHLSQLDLATELDISSRHLSFVETGRSQPSRGMVLRLPGWPGRTPRAATSFLIGAGGG